MQAVGVGKKMNISELIFPAILCVFGLFCIFSKNDMTDVFMQSASGGVKSAISLIPSLVLLMTATSMFVASGGAEILSRLLSPVLNLFKIPKELSTLITIRPISGSGSTALLTDIYKSYGADSFISKCASVICASSDTVFYIFTLYMSKTGVKRTAYTLPVAMVVNIIGILLSVIFCNLLFQ